ncbi:arabinosyltransferase domain-containing protein [Saccharopolyspora erythraea]|uniref:arabinosyltransferase domain-containing protein n=1 Tax=Saccharopolyspora erythraea TaxID=1836 RepID=UPI001BA4DFA7|nr:arabinosyltransferase domain-containing protein [Saccharopolyspora erythraea]QUG99549.1 arabinosyltransferase domain-containing protein [Saccharopolyspora erythraea]
MADGKGLDAPERGASAELRDQVALEFRQPAPRGRSARVLSAILGIVVGLLGLLAAVAVPLAPVVAREVTVTWPKAAAPARSTLAFFVPYRPVSVDVDVPCRVVRSGQQLGRPATLVSSRLPGQPTAGFAVTTASGTALVLVGGREALRAPIGRDCAISLHSDASGSTARIGDRTATLPGVRVEDVVAFATDLPPDAAAGMRVTARAANPFENEPTAEKALLVWGQFLLAGLAFVVLAVRTRGMRVVSVAATTAPLPVQPGPPATDGNRARTTHPNDDGTTRLDSARTALLAGDGAAPVETRVGAWRRAVSALVDLLVVGVLGGWWVLGPNTPDDSFASVTITNALNTGDVGNYYRWENASEAPFLLAQRLLELMAGLSAAPLAMRVPSVIAALLTWQLLSRGVLSAVIPEHSRKPSVRALAALSFLAWWLPFGLGVRPEPFVALGVVAALAFTLQGVRQQRLGLLGAAALCAGLSVAVNPMGITALAPFVVLAGRLRRMLRAPDVLLLAAIASTGLVAMFADQSLAGAREATRLHGFYGPNVPWYLEIQRYQFLLGFDLQGDVARRAPVLLTAVVLLFTALLLSRGARWLPGMRMAGVPAGCLAISLALMWLTPSKWTHYFGALAGVGAATLTAGVVLVVVTARRLAGERTVVLLGLLCTGLGVVAAALTFAGKNNWFLHSHYGVPWGDEPVHPLNNPLLWGLGAGALLLAAAVLGAVRKDRFAARRTLVRMPAVLGVTAVGTTVALVLYSFAVAPLRQSGSYSVGGQNLASLTGQSCGIVDHVVVTPDVPGGRLQVSGGDPEAVGFRRNGGFASPPPGGTAWSSFGGGPISTGNLTTGWFPLPAEIPDNRELAVDVAGRTGDGNRIALEFGTRDGVIGERVLDDTVFDGDERPAYPADHVIVDKPQDNPSWRTLHSEVPDGATRVRIRAADGTTDGAGWLAVTGPRIREVIPMAQYLRGMAPILVDWSMTWSAPCLRAMPEVGGGLAEPPAYLVNPPHELGFGGRAAYERVIGGSFAGVREVGHQKEVPTRLLGVDHAPQYAEWGHLIEVDYPLSGNGFDVQSVPVSRWGWRGE